MSRNYYHHRHYNNGHRRSNNYGGSGNTQQKKKGFGFGGDLGTQVAASCITAVVAPIATELFTGIADMIFGKDEPAPAPQREVVVQKQVVYVDTNGNPINPEDIRQNNS